MNDNAHNNSDEAVIIVFGRQGHAKTPRAAWFREEAIGAARKAAEEPGFHVLDVLTQEVRDIASEIDAAKFSLTGRAQLPVIATSIYDRLVVLLASASVGSANVIDVAAAPTESGQGTEGPEADPANGDAIREEPARIVPAQPKGLVPSSSPIAAPDVPREAILPAVIVFGRKDLGRARAGWFTIAEAALACKAAQSHQFRWLPVRTKDEHLAASRISRGQLHGNLTLVLPTVPAATMELLNRLSAKAVKTGAAFPEGSPGRSHPVTWDEIGIGDVVLAISEDGSWWEAKILNRIDDQFVIVWREDPDQPILICSIQDIALLHPSRA